MKKRVRKHLEVNGCNASDIDGQFMDHVDPSLGYWENKALLEKRLRGRLD